MGIVSNTHGLNNEKLSTFDMILTCCEGQKSFWCQNYGHRRRRLIKSCLEKVKTFSREKTVGRPIYLREKTGWQSKIHVDIWEKLPRGPRSFGKTERRWGPDPASSSTCTECQSTYGNMVVYAKNTGQGILVSTI